MLKGDSENVLPFQRVEGKNVAVEKFNMDRHLQPLWDAQTSYKLSLGIEDDLIFRYLMYGPYSKIEDFKDGFEKILKTDNLYGYVVVYKGDPSGPPLVVGSLCYMEVVPADRKCEIGHVWLDPRYRRRNIMDEAIYLMIKHAFEHAKYRRVQWTCNNKNEPSKKMAIRNHFKMEGVQRNYFIAKGLNRDNAVFSIIDSEWEEAKRNFQSRIV